jgi:hypothetical protein
MVGDIVRRSSLRTLRAAFEETMHQKFLADAHQMHLDPHPITRQQIERDRQSDRCDAKGHYRSDRAALAAGERVDFC